MNAVRRLRDPITAAALFLATTAFTLWQNARIAVLWDISFLLDTAQRIALGQLPYRDFPFSYAPLTFLLHAGIIRLFGRVYYPHILLAALAGGAATVLIWRILLRLLTGRLPHAWTVATLLAAPLIVLGIYGVYPHPIYDSDCILVVLLAVSLMQRAEESFIRHGIAGAVCVVPLFVKQNIGLPFLLLTLAAVGGIAVARRLRQASIRPQLAFLTAAAMTLAAALLVIHTTVGLHSYLYWTITYAGQRRLPGFGLIVDIYREPSLLWTLPLAVAGLVLLRNKRIQQGRWRKPTAIVFLAAPFFRILIELSFTPDPGDRAGQLLALWPHLLVLAAVLAFYQLRGRPRFTTLLPFILLATIHGTFLSQQLWGSTYALWPLLMLLIATLLTQTPSIGRPLAVIVAASLLICGSLYALSRDRLSYANFDGREAHATLPELRGLTTPGPWIPAFEELVRFTNAEIPVGDGIVLLPGEEPFYFATGRAPQFPVLLFDPTIDPYTPQQTLEEARARNIRWLVVNRTLQLNGPPHPELAEITRVLEQDFTLYRTLVNYEVYRRK